MSWSLYKAILSLLTKATVGVVTQLVGIASGIQEVYKNTAILLHQLSVAISRPSPIDICNIMRYFLPYYGAYIFHISDFQWKDMLVSVCSLTNRTGWLLVGYLLMGINQ